MLNSGSLIRSVEPLGLNQNVIGIQCLRVNLYLLLEYSYPANCSLFRLSRQYFIKAVPEISGIHQIKSI